MAFDGNGTYNLPAPQYPAIAGTVIDATAYDQILTDLANALSLALVRDGQAPMLGDLDIGNHAIKNVSTLTVAALTGIIDATVALLKVATALPGTNTSQVASCAFVLQQAFQVALPLMAGNAGKWVTTVDGVNASWAALPAFPVQIGSILTMNNTLGGF